MLTDLHLILRNWRSFSHTQFVIPEQSAVIVDTNGSGKTSLLSAIYSLNTGVVWPGHKFMDMLQVGTQYFGVSASDTWFINGNITPSGRLTTRFEIPETMHPPHMLTYVPVDNQWLFLNRTSKLTILDNLVGTVYGFEYTKQLQQLSKIVRNKLSLIKRYLETGQDDILLAKQLTERTVTVSQQLWRYRKAYLLQIHEALPEFSSWLNRTLDCQIAYEIALQNGSKRTKQLVEFTDYESLSIDYELLWDAEKRAGRVLFGAQRDDFRILWNNRSVETIFSRGEMRLFVLFAKHIASRFGLKIHPNTDFFWLLDDVFNEFDSIREQALFEYVLSQSYRFIATATHAPSQDIPTYSLAQLLKGSS